MTDVDATVEGWDFSTGRFWSYSKKDWTPKWPFRWGVPEIGNTDEWGRLTIVWGTKFTGYVVWAFHTCWCPQCHRIRKESYEWLRTAELEGKVNHDLSDLQGPDPQSMSGRDLV